MNNETINEITKEPGVKHSYPIPGGARMTTFDLKRMSPESIAKYKLEKYTHTKAGDVN